VICDLERRYAISEASVIRVVMDFFTSNWRDVECVPDRGMIPSETLASFSGKKKSMQPFMSLLGGTILPPLYGLLGACIYIIRSLASTPIGLINFGETAVNIPLRLGLGAIAGLALGWFNITDDVSKLTTTPFAIAFVAGFSIDILFSFLERVVMAFSTTPAASTTPATNATPPVRAAQSAR
jgi:hypothetical protein